ncbi:MAG: hypothetical protein ACXW1D_00005 [Halobacteriota archaeon]
MFKQIKEAVFGKQTVDGVIGNFQKTLTQLNAVEAAQSDEAHRQGAAADAALKAAQAAEAEAVRAGKVATKIQALLNAD